MVTRQGQALLRTYQNRLSTTVRRAGRANRVTFIAAMLGADGDPETAWERWAAQMLALNLGAQRQVVQLVDAYLAQLATFELDEPTRPAGLPADDYAASRLRGVDEVTKDRRPLVTMYAALGRGEPFERAVEVGANRADVQAQTDVQLSARTASRDIMAADRRIVGYRRVLSGAENCVLCVQAATQRYRTGDLMPIHSRCDCGVLPIYGTNDPGRVIDAQVDDGTVIDARGALRQVRNLSGRVNLDDLPKAQVREHGELGPVLVREGDGFTGPTAVA